MNREAIAAMVAKQCKAQGLSVTVSDPAILSKIARLVAPGMPRGPLDGRTSNVRRGKNKNTPATAVSLE